MSPRRLLCEACFEFVAGVLVYDQLELCIACFDRARGGFSKRIAVGIAAFWNALRRFRPRTSLWV